MKKHTKSLLEEINSLAPKKNKVDILESRGSNALSSLINLMEMIDQNFDDDTAQDLQKRLMLSIKNRDTDRFMRGVKKIRNQ